VELGRRAGRYTKAMRYLKPMLALWCVGGVGLASAAPVPKAWKDIYAKVSKTIVDNDVPGYMKWMDKGFVNLQDGKKTGYDEYQKTFADFLKKFTNIAAEAVPLSFHKSGDDVVINFHYTFSGDIAQAGKTKTLRFFEEGVDTWRKVDGRYLEVVEVVKKQGVLPADKA
jgi:hypothetical protein